jgi:polysaccharide biosynthesis/export protein
MNSTRRFNRPSRDWAVLALAGLAVLAIALLPAVALPQTAPPAPTPRGYRIAAGDVLQVDVVGRTDISGQYPVNKDGDVTLPILGTVPATGRTTNELGIDISRRISLISRDIPQVTVSVVQAYRRKNFVLGAVILPGSFMFSKAPNVWEAISEAGGPTDEADLSRVEVVSEMQATPTIVDLASAVQAGNLESLPVLKPGDTVRVPRRLGQRGGPGDFVFVFGAVGVQGSQPLSEAPDLLRALIRSGPAADANFSDVEIVRKSGPRVVSMKVNLDDYLEKATLGGNPELQTGDTIYLARNKNLSPWRIAGIALGVLTSIAVLTNNY